MIFDYLGYFFSLFNIIKYQKIHPNYYYLLRKYFYLFHFFNELKLILSLQVQINNHCAYYFAIFLSS